MGEQRTANRIAWVGAKPYSAALLILAAAVIHFSVAPHHYEEYPLHGFFFVGLAIAQLALAATLLIAPSRRLLNIAVAGTSIVIAIWLTSRTVGLPIGPVAWRPEPIGLLDFLATLTEAISIAVLLLLLRRDHRRPRGRLRVVLFTAPALALTLAVSLVGVGSALSPMAVAFNAAPAQAGRPSTSIADLRAPNGSEPVRTFTLTAVTTTIGGHQAWAYNGSVPGPELRVIQGDRVVVNLVNRLPVLTSIHWHGIRTPGAADGVAGLTQNAVRSGESFKYEFVASDPGTFWYHSHQDTSNQVPRGLFGAIIVEPKASAATPVKRDYSLLIHALPGVDTIAVNGSRALHLDAAPGETVRLRLTNSANPFFDGLPQMPVLLGAPYRVVALDGHDLNGPTELGPQRIPLGMGQRADLTFTMPGSGSVQLVGIEGVQAPLPFGPPKSTTTVTIGGGSPPNAADLGSLPRFDLTRYGSPGPDPVADASHFDVTHNLLLAGGMSFREGTLEFTDAFNGRTSPDITPIRVRTGQVVRLHIVNQSQKWHPIHIHGHVFSILAKGGRALTGSPVHVDAVLIGPNESWDVAFGADNPGVWMLHCHVLSHAAGGMSMTINYEGVSTPFTMGNQSGNIPE